MRKNKNPDIRLGRKRSGREKNRILLPNTKVIQIASKLFKWKNAIPSPAKKKTEKNNTKAKNLVFCCVDEWTNSFLKRVWYRASIIPIELKPMRKSSTPVFVPVIVKGCHQSFVQPKYEATILSKPKPIPNQSIVFLNFFWIQKRTIQRIISTRTPTM